MSGAFIAVDWGTTNRRAFLLDGSGEVLGSRRDDRGVTSVPPGAFADEVAAMRRDMGDLPMLCAGMVGSDRGWTQVSYVECPAALHDLAEGVVWMDERTGIVPGLVVREAHRTDVMRGEEVQLFGAVALAAAPPDALLCQPGTHCKWAWMDGGRVDRFVTAMTGEIFALLRSGSLLSKQLLGEPQVGPSFRAGVTASLDGDLASRLFGVRADVVTGRRMIDDPSSFVSGLLIGGDVRLRIGAGDVVHVLADPVLGAFYVEAIAMVGGEATLIDSHAAFVGGITRIWNGVR